MCLDQKIAKLMKLIAEKRAKGEDTFELEQELLRLEMKRFSNED